jgi:broad specificity phosphatase PhoE
MDESQRLRLYLMRHGEVERGGRLLGRTDAALSTRGVEQAHELGKVLTNARLSIVYSSDLQRARTTADIVAKHTSSTVRADAAWREIDMGQWDDRTLASVHQEAPQLVAQLFNDPASFEYPDGESFPVFIARVQKALEHLQQTHERGDVALVTHGGVCRAIIGTVLEMPPCNWLRLAQDHGCLNIIDWYGKNPILQLLNSRPGASE